MEDGEREQWLSLVTDALTSVDDLDDAQMEENMQIAASIWTQLKDNERSPNIVALMVLQLQSIAEEEDTSKYDIAFV